MFNLQNNLNSNRIHYLFFYNSLNYFVPLFFWQNNIFHLDALDSEIPTILC